MLLHGHFRPGYVCNGSDLNGNPYPLIEVPLGMMAMLNQAETVPIFAPNGRRLRFPRSPATHEMQHGAVMLLIPMRGPPPGGFGEPRLFHPSDPTVPPSVYAEEATERAEEETERAKEETERAEEATERAEEGEDKRGEEEPEDPVLEDEANQPVDFSSCKARFNGIGSIKQFLEEVLEFKVTNKMSDETALRSFHLLFQGLVNDWWAEKRKYITDWQSALKMFRICYRIYPLQPRIFTRFFCRPQRNESTAAFIERVRGVFRTLPLPNFTEESQLDLAYAMLHSRIKVKVSRADFKTFTELLERAQQVEHAIMASTPQTVRQPAAPANPGERKALPTSPPLDPLSGGNAASKNTCDYCLSYGDLLISMCRKVHRGENVSTEYVLLEIMNQLDKEELSKLVCLKCRTPNVVGLKCENCGPEISGNCPLITVRIDDKEFNFVIDTGINYSVASEDLAKYLIAKGYQLAMKVVVTPSTDGREPHQTIARVATVDVTVSDVKIPVELVVIERGRMFRNVFGMEFIKEAGLVMDFRSAGTWTVRGTTEKHPVLFERFGNWSM